MKGGPAHLEYEIAGTAPFDITWSKNRKPITSDKKYKIISQDYLSRLEILTFESADVGDFQCIVSNEVGKVTTKAVAKLKGNRTSGAMLLWLDFFRFKVVSLCFCRTAILHQES